MIQRYSNERNIIRKVGKVTIKHLSQDAIVRFKGFKNADMRTCLQVQAKDKNIDIWSKLNMVIRTYLGYTDSRTY